MARAGPNSATSDFFICIGDQPALDFGGHRNLDGQGFAAFGRVTEGMAIVRAIQGSPANGQQLDPPIADHPNPASRQIAAPTRNPLRFGP